MAERGVDGSMEEEKDMERGEETATLLSITLWERNKTNFTAVQLWASNWVRCHQIWRANQMTKRWRDRKASEMGTDLVYAGFDSHHYGITKHFAIFRQSFPGLKSGLILKVHPVTRRCHLSVNYQYLYQYLNQFHIKIPMKPGLCCGCMCQANGSV